MVNRSKIPWKKRRRRSGHIAVQYIQKTQNLIIFITHPILCLASQDASDGERSITLCICVTYLKKNPSASDQMTRITASSRTAALTILCREWLRRRGRAERCRRPPFTFLEDRKRDMYTIAKESNPFLVYPPTGAASKDILVQTVEGTP